MNPKLVLPPTERGVSRGSYFQFPSPKDQNQKLTTPRTTRRLRRGETSRTTVRFRAVGSEFESSELEGEVFVSIQRDQYRSV